MTPRERPILLLAAAMLIAPLIGGHILVDVLPCPSGFAALLAAATGGPEAPLLAHFLIALPIVAAIAWVALRARIVQVPSGAIGGSLAFLALLVIYSSTTTQFPAVSAASGAEWLIYLAAFFAAAAIAGHGLGPRLIVAATAVGCAIVAVIAVWEFAGQRDPTWRVFATWVNPNTLAGMLILGWFGALGLAASAVRTERLAFGVCAGLIGVALLLTQSRGGLLAVGLIGLPVFAAMLLAVKAPWKAKGAALGTVALCVVLSLLLTVGLMARPKAVQSSDPRNALTRLTTSSDHAREQSSAFRMLLWKGCLGSIGLNPAGTGIGTYRYESSRSGLTPPTQLAHETYLQLAVEASALAPMALLAALVLWAGQMLRGSRQQPFAAGALKAGIVAAVAASAVHGLLDSDLYSFGIAITFFTFLGVGLQVGVDGVSPEAMPRPASWAMALASLAVAGVLGWLGFARLEASIAMGDVSEGRLAEARARLESARSLAPFDGELWYLSAVVAESREDRLRRLMRAVSLCPSPRFFRALGREQAESGKDLDAIVNYGRALDRDPHNLPALLQLMRLYQKRLDRPQAIATARRLVAVESSPYFTTRALPELVPTETLQARIYLAGEEKGLIGQAELLAPALAGYRDYLSLTYPQVRAMAESSPPLDYAGQNLQTARDAIQQGLDVATRLGRIYRELGRPAADVDRAATLFRDALSAL